MLYNKKAILFDCDGVVLDTESQYSAFWAEIGKQKFPNVADFAARIKGQTLSTIKSEWFGTDPDLLAWLDEQLSRFEETMHYPYIKGAANFLNKCRKEGMRTALVTSSNRKKMAQVIKHIPHFYDDFDALVLAEDVRLGKPAPDCFLLAADRLGIAISDCIVIEDSLNGLLAAQASGAFVVGLTTSLPAHEIAHVCHEVWTNWEEKANNH